MLICFQSLTQFVRTGYFTIKKILNLGASPAAMDLGEKREKLAHTQSYTAAPVHGSAYNTTTGALGDLGGS